MTSWRGTSLSTGATLPFQHYKLCVTMEVRIYILISSLSRLGLSHKEKNLDLRVFENRVLRRIFGRKREEVIGDWRRLHNEERHKLYALQNFIRMIESSMLR
jgi:hypothetical protein